MRKSMVRSAFLAVLLSVPAVASGWGDGRYVAARGDMICDGIRTSGMSDAAFSRLISGATRAFRMTLEGRRTTLPRGCRIVSRRGEISGTVAGGDVAGSVGGRNVSVLLVFSLSQAHVSWVWTTQRR